MEFHMNRSRRLQPVDKVYMPTPRTRRMILRTNLTKTSRLTKGSPKKPTLSKFQPANSQPNASLLPLVSTSNKVNATVVTSPSAAFKETAGTSRLVNIQATVSASTTLNQSGTIKMMSATSLFQSTSRQTTELPSLGTAGKDEVQYPLTPGQALKRFISQLTEFEQAEILEYKQIYFLGLTAAKVSPVVTKSNFGYDDERADYVVVVGDHIAYRYEVIGHLGKGSFGQVLKCFDHKRQEDVALKIIRNKRRFHQQGAVEIKVLETLRDNDLEDGMGIVRLKNYLMFRKHICMTFEMLSINLYEFLKINNFQGLSLGLIRRFAIQLLLSLRYVAELKVIHCDLKPENILLRSPDKSGIKIIDFGSACFEDSRVYTYIQSRFYRAPEIMLGIPYTPSIDMWSLACILAELFHGYPLFPGESEREQMQCIMEVLGYPPRCVLERSTRQKLFFEENGEAKMNPNSRGKTHKPGSKVLEQVIRCQEKLFLDFLRKCLDWDAVTRMKPEAALQHPWILEGMPKLANLTQPRDSSRPRTNRQLAESKANAK